MSERRFSRGYAEEIYRRQAEERGRFVQPTAPVAAPERTNKYGNEGKDGYASTKEANRAQELRLLQFGGAIRNLREQVEYVLIPPQADPITGAPAEAKCSYVADFVYEEPFYNSDVIEEQWRTVVEDSKGVITQAYKIKRKLMLMVYRIRILET